MNQNGNTILSEKKCFASHLKYIFFIGMGFTFSLNILFLFENGKPATAILKWDLHSQKEYPF